MEITLQGLSGQVLNAKACKDECSSQELHMENGDDISKLALGFLCWCHGLLHRTLLVHRKCASLGQLDLPSLLGLVRSRRRYPITEASRYSSEKARIGA